MDILPIACSLSPEELASSASDLIPGLLERASSVTRLADGVRLELPAAADVLRAVTEVIERERQCCRFLQFALTVPPDGKPFRLDITGPEGTPDFLAEVSLIARR